MAQQIDLASMPVEDSYDGPRMEGAQPWLTLYACMLHTSLCIPVRHQVVCTVEC